MWILNTTAEAIDAYISAEQKFITIPVGRPIEIVSVSSAIEVLHRYGDHVRECRNPADFFTQRPMRLLIIRDAGIGDLLLAEPIIRKAKKTNCELTVLCGFPEVYEGNPAIDFLKKSENRNDMAKVNMKEFDQVIDLRSYSETAASRGKEHRTDVYNEKFSLKLTDEEKEPRLHLPDEIKPAFKRKAGHVYIGMSVEATHKYRGIQNYEQIADCILKDIPNSVVVLFGKVQDGKKAQDRIIDLRGKTDVRQMLQTVAALDSMVAVDSGVMHVALTLHIPTVCIFSIITPDIRIRYYTGQKTVVTSACQSIGCGNFHMQECKDDTRRPDFVPVCANIDPAAVVAALQGFTPHEVKKFKQTEAEKIEFPSAKLTMAIITLNEEHNLKRFIPNVIKNKAIGRVVCVDGGSTDRTVEMLKAAGVQVYKHLYDREYHDMQAMQRNYSLSFVKDGEKVIIMDPDEEFSPELSAWLPSFSFLNIDYGEVSRRTFEYWKDTTNPDKQIKNYPDYQPRLYTWHRRFKFCASPHHITLNTPPAVRIDKDIIHAEREGKDREALEKQWSEMWTKTKGIYK